MTNFNNKRTSVHHRSDNQLIIKDGTYDTNKKVLQDGMKERVTFPSHQRQVDESSQIEKLEAMMSNLNQEKQRLEQEMTKFPPTGGKSIRDIKHRRDVEQNLEYIDTNIDQIRKKLREFKVL